MSKRRKKNNLSRKRSKPTANSVVATSTQKSLDNFNPDYTYVKKDLRTIGILAGIFITILIILSFIL